MVQPNTENKRRRERAPCVRLLVVLSLGGWALAETRPVTAGKHPSLVSAEAAECADCHADLLERSLPAHSPAAEDCTLCHDVVISDDGTSVDLVESDPELCLLCHDDLSRAVEGDLETPHFPVMDSCLSCHDAHGSNEPSLLIAPQAVACAECHDAADLGPSHQGQVTTSSRCSSCHEAHGSEHAAMLVSDRLHQPFAEGSCTVCHREPFGDRIRLRARGRRLCTACHGDMAGEAASSVHAAIADSGGENGCASCHDPHLSRHPSLVTASGPGLCVECHREVVEGAIADDGHVPAGEDCQICHASHAAPEPHLLNEPAGELCAACHDPGDPDLETAHLGAEVGTLRCTECHSPHGAGQPHALAEFVHAPVLDGCDLCHEGSHAALVDDGGTALCGLCHEDVVEAAAESAVPHAAMELGTCTDCHNPHASAIEALIREPAGEICGECHDEQVAGDGEVLHGVVELVGCRACHEPHGGTAPSLLRADASQLCLSCHDPTRVVVDAALPTTQLLNRFELPTTIVQSALSLRLSADGRRDHPVAHHRTLGPAAPTPRGGSDATFEGEMTCLTCHDPHKGRSRQLLRWGAASAQEACQACHTKK